MDSISFICDFSKFPDKDLDPFGWNQAWERYLDEIYVPRSEYRDPPFLKLPASVCLSQAFLSTQDVLRRELCQLQFDLAEFVAEKRLMDNFEKKWRSYPSETRQQHLLQGLVNTCAIVADMEERRKFCPETTMLNLQRDGGMGFLDLLATVCPPGVTQQQPLSEPIFISHPIVDSMLRIGEPCPPGGNKAVRLVMQRWLTKSRNSFIGFFLWTTILRLYGKYETYTPARVAGDKTRLQERGDILRNRPPTTYAKEVKSMKDQTKQSIKIAQWHCANCTKPERDLLAGEKFLACSGCRSIGRKIMYCDRQCQLNDWKKGNPPHKAFCGKAFDLPESLDVTPLKSVPIPNSEDLDPPNASPPPPDPGFLRSAALELQISLLQGSSAVSYFLVESRSKPDHAILLQHSASRPLFETARNKAMKNGDLHSVSVMYDFLEEHAQNVGFSEERLLSQLSMEYGVSVESLSATRNLNRTTEA